MNKITTILTVVLVLMMGEVCAEEASSQTKTFTQKDILGTWTVWAESHGKDKDKKKLNNIWRFENDGELHASSTDPRTEKMNFNTPYSVEKGVLKKEKMGRPGKYDYCNIDIQDTEMVLSCGNMYYFLTKKL